MFGGRQFAPALRTAFSRQFRPAQPPGSPKNLSSTKLQLSVPHRPGALYSVLELFKKHNINLTSIQSRRASRRQPPDALTLTVECDHLLEPTTGLLGELAERTLMTTVLESFRIPEFPHHISDLFALVDKCKMAGTDLTSDHPGFSDPKYRERRARIAENTKSIQYGKPIPDVEYTATENETWKIVFQQLMRLFPTHPCVEYQRIFPLLVESAGYRSDRIPQLQDISEFLFARTGFTIVPVTGLLSSRDFLNGLAFRVFFSTQYIRHHSKPLYTPEPDVCHELLGHVPLFGDPDFADFSQAIGLASIAASDEDILKLSTCYWFTVEFGLCKQHGSIRAYGAGLLSSFGELEYCKGDKPELRPFNLHQMALQPYPITTYQPIYYVADSFKRMAEDMRVFSESLDRPFDVEYNPHAQTVDISS